jgi:hypothetical protein
MGIYKITPKRRGIPNDFNTLASAQSFIDRLRQYAELMIKKGRYSYYVELKEINNLQVVEVTKGERSRHQLFSVVEARNGVEIIKTFDNLNEAKVLINEILSENENRKLVITETIING